jgi:GrpB-like predicted nucleotidyltransferase (UPF0157 family)
MKELHKTTAAEIGKFSPVFLVEYDPMWNDYFVQEQRTLFHTLPNIFLHIEHIGSTAIDGLKSQPIIDMLAEITPDTDIEALISELAAIGYVLNQRSDNPPRLTFVKGYTPKGFVGTPYHLQVRHSGTYDEIAFRDYLRTHPSARAEYTNLKENLAQTHKLSSEGYTNAKAAFVANIITKAKNDH